MSLELPFQTVDVFTTQRYRGNPLAVVTIPPPPFPQPSQEQKQAIAREFNLSETVFIHDVPEDQKNQQGAVTSREIGIFLTNREIPFAGHPTIGAAFTLLERGEDVDTLVARAGPLKIQPVTISPGDDDDDAAADDEGGRSQRTEVKIEVPHHTHLHRHKLQDIQAHNPVYLSTVHDDIRTAELQAPVFSIVKGMTFILIELPSLEMLSRVVPTPARPSPPPPPPPPSEQQQQQQQHEAEESTADLLADEGWKGGFLSKYYFVRAGSPYEDMADGKQCVPLRTRMMEEFEDPATGSAACCLAAYLSQTEFGVKTDQVCQYMITQGVEMGRESNITVEVQNKGHHQVDKVFLQGTAVSVMRGVITV